MFPPRPPQGPGGSPSGPPPGPPLGPMMGMPTPPPAPPKLAPSPFGKPKPKARPGGAAKKAVANKAPGKKTPPGGSKAGRPNPFARAGKGQAARPKEGSAAEERTESPRKERAEKKAGTDKKPGKSGNPFGKGQGERKAGRSAHKGGIAD